MVFGSSYTVNKVQNLNIAISSNTFELVNKYKYLGIIHDRTLTLDEHVAYLKGKIVGRLKMLTKLHP